MAVIVNRRPACIQANFLALQRMKLFNLSGERIVEVQCHDQGEGKLADRTSNSRGPREKGSNGPRRLRIFRGSMVGAVQALAYKKYIVNRGNNRETNCGMEK